MTHVGQDNVVRDSKKQTNVGQKYVMHTNVDRENVKDMTMYARKIVGMKNVGQEKRRR